MGLHHKELGDLKKDYRVDWDTGYCTEVPKLTYPTTVGHEAPDASIKLKSGRMKSGLVIEWAALCMRNTPKML